MPTDEKAVMTAINQLPIEEQQNALYQSLLSTTPLGQLFRARKQGILSSLFTTQRIEIAKLLQRDATEKTAILLNKATKELLSKEINSELKITLEKPFPVLYSKLKELLAPQASAEVKSETQPPIPSAPPLSIFAQPISSTLAPSNQEGSGEEEPEPGAMPKQIEGLPTTTQLSP